MVIMAFCLRFIFTTSIWYVILAMITGAAIFALGLWLLRAFSAKDNEVINNTIWALNPKLLRGGR
jgi:hypothetical protein